MSTADVRGWDVDFNDDGYIDLLAANADQDTISVLLSNGNGTFESQDLSNVTVDYPSYVAGSDFNGDQKTDLVVSNYFAGTISILLGDGQGAFVNVPGDIPVGVKPSMIAGGDFNGDGLADLAVANKGNEGASDGTIAVLYGKSEFDEANAGNSFEARVDIPVGAYSDSLSVVDLDNNGSSDLVVGILMEAKISVLLNGGIGAVPQFESQVKYDVGVHPHDVVTADFNNDGFVDVATPNFSSNNISILFGNGEGSFPTEDQRTEPLDTSPHGAATGDFNADGNVDLVTANHLANSVSILLGDGQGGFEIAADTPVSGGQGPNSVAVGDFNSDGLDDIVVGFNSGDHLAVMINQPTTLVLDPVAAIEENGTATLTGTITDLGTLDTFTLGINWGDPLSPGNTETVEFEASATGSQTFTLTHQYLDDNPSGTPSDPYMISARVFENGWNNEAGTFIANYVSSAPTIDGAFTPGEWGTSSDVTFERRDGGGVHDSGLYFQYDKSFLYVGVDSRWGTGWDVVWDLWFDGDHNGDLNGNLTSPYIDLQITEPSPSGYGGYVAYRALPNIGEEVRVGFGSGATAASGGSSNVFYEFAIPLTDLDVIEGDSIGFYISHGYDGISNHLYQMAGATRLTPQNWLPVTLGLIDDQSVSVTVNNVPPTVVLDPVAPIDGNGTATLTGTITDPGRLDTFTLDIDWGDPLSPGNTETVEFGASATGSQTFTLTHRYRNDTSSGAPSNTYTISATVSDDDNGESSDTERVVCVTTATWQGEDDVWVAPNWHDGITGGHQPPSNRRMIIDTAGSVVRVEQDFVSGGTGPARSVTIGENYLDGHDVGAGEAEAFYDPVTGELFFSVGEGVAVVGIGSAEVFSDNVDTSSIFGPPAQNDGALLAYFNASGISVGQDSVGIVLPPGLTQADILFSYTPIGSRTVQMPVTLVGESWTDGDSAELRVNAVLEATDDITIGPHATLSGVGTIQVGDRLRVTAGGTVSPGNGLGTLSVDGAAVLEGHSTLEVELSGGDTVVAGINNDLINVQDLTLLDNPALELKWLAGEVGGIFTIATYAGVLTGTFANPALSPDFNGNGSVYIDTTYGVGGIDYGSGTNDTITVLVTNINDPPIAQDDLATTDSGTPVTIDVLANDSDEDAGDILSVTSVSQGSNGLVELNDDDTVTYLPDIGFIGTDSFTYTISDGHGGTSQALVTVDVVVTTYSWQGGDDVWTASNWHDGTTANHQPPAGVNMIIDVPYSIVRVEQDFLSGGIGPARSVTIGENYAGGHHVGVGEAEALYNPVTGELFLDVGEGIAVVGIGSAEIFSGNVDTSSIFGPPAQNDGNSLAYFNPSGLSIGQDSVGIVLPPGLTQADMFFSYTPINSKTVRMPVTLVGESWNESDFVELKVNAFLETTYDVAIGSHATVSGIGTIQVGDRLRVASGGTISPGNGLGTLSIEGDVVFEGGSTLAAEISGSRNLVAGINNDVLTAGDLTLMDNPALKLEWLAGEVSDGLFGGIYTIATYSGTLTGTFAAPSLSASFSGADASIYIDTTYGIGGVDYGSGINDAITVKLNNLFVGDANLDGDVDVWQIDGKGDSQVLSEHLGRTPADGPTAAQGMAEAIYYPPTGELLFDVGEDIEVVGVQSALMFPEGVDVDTPLGDPTVNDRTSLAFFDPTGLAVGEHTVGLVLPQWLTAEDMTFSFEPIGGELTQMPVTVIGWRWSDGDFNFDGDVDVWQFDGKGDAQLLSGNLGSSFGLDFGDASFPYPTALDENGARHIETGPTLGPIRDTESDGSHSPAADADDATGTPDDEDGVAFGSIVAGQLGASVTVNVQHASRGAKLDAWIDFNADGSWGGPFEQIADTAPVINGENTITFDVPSWAVDGTTYARFRLSTNGGLGTAGAAADGEVEDYQITIMSPATANGVFGKQSMISETAEGAFSVFAADMDSDGDMDVLSASHRDDKIVWYENDGSQAFVPHIVSDTADGALSVFAADVDGDGDMDVLSATYVDDKIAWYENDGSQNFTLRTISTDANKAYSVFAADVDGDGDVDVLSASYDDDKIAWYENDGNQAFTPHPISNTADGARSVFAADVDRDGDMDVLSASEFDNKIAWYENEGSQNFTTHIVSDSAFGARSVFATDVDSDGVLDILSASSEDDKIVWYKNDGSQNFTPYTISSEADGAESVFAADLDGDGDVDVLSGSWYDGRIAWYENDGSQNFTSYTISTVAQGAGSVIAADVDGDGDLDVLSASESDNKIAWYENDSQVGATPVMAESAIAPSNQTNPLTMLRLITASAADAAMQEAISEPPVTFPADLDWQVEFENAQSKAAKRKDVEATVDLLLATNWQ